MEAAHGRGRFRTRLPHLLCLWGGAAVAELVLYYLFLRQPYFRALGVPFAVVVLLAALFGTWHLLRPRAHGDRRHGDRRHEHRRTAE
jgi:hypothetical protein